MRSWRGRGGRTLRRRAPAGRRQRVRRRRRPHPAPAGQSRARHRRRLDARRARAAWRRCSPTTASRTYAQGRELRRGPGAARHGDRASACSASSRASRRRSSPSSASRTSSATAWCARAASRARAADVLTEATSLSVGDLVVHADHGIGRFVGLKTITALGAPHDCLELHYAGGDKLFLPVENIELLSRYGADEADAQLDKLGGVAWQSRKARLKKRLREIAVRADQDRGAAPAARRRRSLAAAGRRLRRVRRALPLRGDRGPGRQHRSGARAISASGRPMDRLVCGDVGFGKTEVALRAAFVAAMSGLQVAVVVPTTLLARQHFKTFTERFKGLPVTHRAGLAPGRRQGAGRGEGGPARTARSTSSSARMRCSASRSSSRASACSSSTRSSTSASRTRSG